MLSQRGAGPRDPRDVVRSSVPLAGCGFGKGGFSPKKNTFQRENGDDPNIYPNDFGTSLSP